MKKTSWIALLTVKPLPGNADLDDAVIAAVNVLLLTENAVSYEQEIGARMLGFGYEVMEIEDVTEFDSNDPGYVEDLILKAQLLTPDYPLQWGTFYASTTLDEE